MEDLGLIKKAILKRLVKHKCWGGKHTDVEHLRQGFPSHMKGSKEVNRAIKELFVDGLILKKPASYGLQVFLNPKKKSEIEKLAGISE